MTFTPTPPLRHSDVDWSRGRCKTGGYDPDLWFEDDGDNGDNEALAVRICRTGVDGLPCPIRELCLQYALDSGQKFGVWGGMTSDERKVSGWAKHRVRCPSCRSTKVEPHVRHVEMCLSCGFSWPV